MGDLDNDGDLDIVSGGGSGEVIAWDNDGSPFTDPWTQNDVGASWDSVYSVALGDLDNDGDLDIVSGSWALEDYEVIAWENDGSPFTDPWTQNDVGASADHVFSVALGDLDNDGDLDIVSGSWGAEDYEVIAWQNDGSPFTDLWTQNDVGASTYVLSVALGDLDNDGDLDIVSGGGSGEVIAWDNDGSPFTDPWTQNDVGASWDSVYSVALGDLDIVSGSWALEDYEVIAWENDGSPFTDPWTQNDVGASADHVFSVTLGDLDNDGDLDIVSGSWGGTVIAWENEGSPFTDPWTQNDVGASANTVFSVALGDLDNDGDLDIVSGSVTYEVIAWQNDGTPFTDPWTHNDVGASADHVSSVALGDLDNDGDLDIVSGSHAAEDYEVIAWENDGSPFTDPWTQNDVGASTGPVYSVALGDLDNDGDLDIVFGTWSAEDYEVIAWENEGSPFTDPWTQNDVGASTGTVSSVAVGDLDHDGDPDIVSGGGWTGFGEVIAWQNDGSPFTDSWTHNDVGATTDQVHSVTLGDLDNDGDLDTVSGSSSAEDYEVTVWENDGSPFADPWTQNDVGASTDRVSSEAVGDLDHDGDLDIVSGGWSAEIIAWENALAYVYLPFIVKNY